MKISETLKLLDDKDFLDKIYGFSYHRCNTSHEAEELCSEIILSVVSAISKQAMIENFYAFVWTVAHRVYADYCRKRNSEHQVVDFENSDMSSVFKDEIDEYIESEAEQEQIKRIFKEIAFLSKAYREVMIMFYIDEMKVKDIAEKLNINETTVKQRLFSARNSVKKEVETMNERSYVLKPIKLYFLATGKVVGHENLNLKAERLISQNLIYLCKERPKSAKELSEELYIPMPYIEEELEILCQGTNGEYGFLRKLNNGKYALNIHLVDYDEYNEVNEIYQKYLPEFCKAIKNVLKQKEDAILSFPYLNEQKDLSFIMWSLIHIICLRFSAEILDVLGKTFFSDITSIEREFSCTAIAYTEDQTPDFDFYGCEIPADKSIGGYKLVELLNIYGKHIEKRFEVGHNLSLDEKFLIVLKAIGGIAIEDLSETEREIAAKALEDGYLRKKENIIEPRFIVIDGQNRAEAFWDFFDDLSNEINSNLGSVVEQIAEELYEYMKKHIPEHLMNEYESYLELIATGKLTSKIIDGCIKEGILKEPENRLGAEGVLVFVEK